MPESFLGDGLIFEESLPLAWTPGPRVEGIELTRLNADNQQLLGAEASLDDVRVHDALKDESAERELSSRNLCDGRDIWSYQGNAHGAKSTSHPVQKIG
jgi:hypothetical protein